MNTRKALLCALGVTVVSVILLTTLHGSPTSGQLVGNGVTMFTVAFIVLKFAK